MVTLCIAEPYYMIGLCRYEIFPSEQHANAYRSRLAQNVTTWFLGEEVPKRKPLASGAIY